MSSLSQHFMCDCTQEPGVQACVEGLVAAKLGFPMQQSSVAGSSPSFCSFCYLNHVLSENTFGTGREAASGQTALLQPLSKGPWRSKIKHWQMQCNNSWSAWGRLCKWSPATVTSQQCVHCSFICVTPLNAVIMLQGVITNGKVNIAMSHQCKTLLQMRQGAGTLSFQISKGDYWGSATCLMPKSLLS